MNATQLIEHKALEIGFIACGVSRAGFLAEESERLNEWLKRGYQGTMGYLERNVDKRLDPTLLVEGTKSIISVAYNYFPEKSQNPEAKRIAKYAYGEDYHRVVKDKCYELLAYIKTLYPEVNTRVFVDSAPVMERQWAQKSGIGWIGKNSLLLRKGVGSYFFLGEIFLDCDLPESGAYVTDHCGDCTRCIDACPTQAIVANQVIDSKKCISYVTIEKRDPLLSEELDHLHGWLFGCDICQDVCPWNRFATPHNEPRFEPIDAISWNADQWEHLDKDGFDRSFQNSPIARMGFHKLQQLRS
jgi:epoxyqueuosine reductase